MEDIHIEIQNNAQNVLPVPYANAPTPNVAYPMNYGSAPYAMAVQAVPNHKNDESQYCNFLEPSPRNQNLNVPYEGETNCPVFEKQPYSKDSCYLLDSKAQGVVGIACNQAGGSDNANFVRGNDFGVDYDPDEIYNRKKKEYTVEQPVQIPMEMQNPLMKYDRNTFYPYPSFALRGKSDFITYPLEQNFTENGIPTYTYPYKTMNPLEQSGPEQIIENFDTSQKGAIAFFSSLFVLLVIIGILFFYKKFLFIKLIVASFFLLLFITLLAMYHSVYTYIAYLIILFMAILFMLTV